MNFSTFRSLCLALPSAQESPHFEKVSFRIRKKIFATYDSNCNQATVKLSIESQSLFISMSRGTVQQVKNKWGAQGWTEIDLDLTEPKLTQDIIKHAYYDVAPETYANLLAPMIFMDQSYITSETILIPASPLRVWKVITETDNIKQWDEIPEGNDLGDELNMDTELVWVLPDGQYSKLRVTELKAQEKLRLNLFVSHWEMSEELYDIAYTYTLSPSGNGTMLSLEIGDFAPLKEAEIYHQSSEKFAQSVLNKISAISSYQLVPHNG